MVTAIIAVQFEQVEGIQEHLMVVGVRVQLLEIRNPIIPAPNGFPINGRDDGTRDERSASSIQGSDRSSRSPGG